jgi:LPS export ABC transporter protein LptC
MGLSKLTYAAIIAMILFALATCSRETQPESDDEVLQDTTYSRIPDQILTHSDILLSNHGIREALVHSEYLEKYLRIDSTLLVNIDATFYDSLGNLSSTLTADSGIVREKTRELKSWGDVVVKSHNGVTLEADSLYWNEKENRIVTESYVRLTQNGSVQTGYGLESDSRLTNFKIKRRVKASFEKSDLMPEDST